MTSPDPDETAKIANEIALTFQSSVVEIMNIENVQIISEAVPDPDPVSPHVVNNLLIGLGVGLLSGFGVAMLRYAMAKTIDDYQYVTQTIGWPNLGIISEMNKEEKTAITAMLKQKAAAANAVEGAGLGESTGASGTEKTTKTKRIPEEKPPAKIEKIQAATQVNPVIAALPGKKESPKTKTKQHSSGYAGANRERLVTVADMTKQKIDVILQSNDVSETADTGNKRGKR